MTKVDVLVIGCGMAGILAGIHLQKQGKSFLIVEKGSTLGGTWRDNTYPGLTCDVTSHAYTYSFEPNPDWTRVFPSGAEIQSYFAGVFDKYGLAAHTRFETEITQAAWRGNSWQLQDQHGQHYQAKVVVAATGVLHHPNYPKIQGLEHFEGRVLHSARWDHTTPTKGQRIAVIGNGSTGVQLVSALAADNHVHHFQRTAQWVYPVENMAFTEEQRAEFRRNPELLKYLQNEPTYVASVERFTQGVLDANSPQILEIEGICRDNLENSVHDPVLREKLRPNYRAGCKRLIYSPDYYRAIQHPNSRLVTEGIVQVEADGIRTEDGQLHALDLIVLATGYRADQFMRPMHIEGANGQTINAAWAKGTTAYQAISVPDVPNFFMINGPTSPVGNFSLIDVAETQWGYIAQLIERVDALGGVGLSASAQAQASYDTERIAAAKNGVFGAGCKSWYLDANGVPNTWPWSHQRFREEMAQPVWADYTVHQVQEEAALG